MIITISGSIGSGKTTVANEISKSGFTHISAGEIMRRMAYESKKDILEFSKEAEKNFEIDRRIDAEQKRIAEEEILNNRNCVVEGRISAYLINSDLKIWFYAPLKMRAERVSEREKCDLNESLKRITKREKSERIRYKKIYGIDLEDLRIYDLVLNTSKWDVQGMLKIVRDAVESAHFYNEKNRNDEKIKVFESI